MSEKDDKRKYDRTGAVRRSFDGGRDSTGKEKNKTDESKSVQLDTQTVTMDSESNSAQQEAMEEKLAQFLSRMEGAGRVEVLITYASTEEQVIEKEMRLSRIRRRVRTTQAARAG